jgi:dihydroneopterin aldolase
MTKQEGLLTIRGLELKVNLGWRDKELLEPQAIMLDVDIYLPEPPKACQTDDLQDSVCYAELINKIRQRLGNNKYRLIERLATEIFDVIAPEMPETARLRVQVTKKPKIDGLTGGVSYTCLKSCQVDQK